MSNSSTIARSSLGQTLCLVCNACAALAFGPLFWAGSAYAQSSPNFSEIVGNGAGAGISDTYYLGRERAWTKAGQKWVTQIGLDGAFNILKEFWPDINHSVFHGKY